MKKFKTESKRMLDLMINSIYTNREIFLRELLSNASDAIDKLYYKSFTEGISGLTRDDFSISISLDNENRILTVSDNGIGMTAEELETNLGTIAKSGSYQFKNQDFDGDGQKDIDIIGQFGVGFYSSFMVAKKVEVISKAFGSDTANMWVSEGADGYDIKPCEKDSVGTTVKLYLKDDTEEEKYGEFITEYKIKDLVKKYSDYIRYPIKMMVTSYEYPEHHCEDENCTHEHEQPKEVKKEETLNSMVPVWKKAKQELKEGELEQFYKDKFYDAKDPLKVISISAEGLVSYKALLYIPETIPFNYYTKNYEKGLELYTSGVLITEKCADLLPDYFNFVKGVVDSELTLNISRETVQQNRELKAIATNIEKKIKAELAKMLEEDREKYLIFFKNFGTSLKYGIYSSWGMNNDLQELLLFYSAKLDKFVTLKEYVEAMGENQKYIYYACGKTTDAVKALPRTGAVLDMGYDVLCLTEDVDEFALKMLRSYNEKEFKSIESGDIGIENTEVALDSTVAEKLMNVLADKVSKVKGSNALKNHPVCLSSEGEVSIEMEKVLSNIPGGEAAKAQKVFEINVQHKVYDKLKEYAETGDEKFEKLVYVLFEQAKLISGLQIEDPSKLTDTIFELI